MTRAPILFRVDAGPRQGWEHLSRCLVLAAAMQRRRRPAYFLAQLEPGSLGLAVKRAGNDWLDADSPAGTPDDVEETIQEVRRLKPAAVVVDAPEATEDYLAALDYDFTAEDEALVDRLVVPGHASTPGYNDPLYPIEGRIAATAAKH